MICDPKTSPLSRDQKIIWKISVFAQVYFMCIRFYDYKSILIKIQIEVFIYTNQSFFIMTYAKLAYIFGIVIKTWHFQMHFKKSYTFTFICPNPTGATLFCSWTNFVTLKSALLIAFYDVYFTVNWRWPRNKFCWLKILQ